MGLMALLLLPLSVFLLPERSSIAQSEAEEPEFELEDWPLTESAADGRETYAQYCIGCHGSEGLGDGEAAPFLRPLPRNFQQGKFKFRSTPTGKLPTLDDLMRTITCGLPGSSMPGFPLLAEQKRRNVAEYVLHLASYRYGKRDVERMVRRGTPLEEISEEDISGLRDAVWNKRVRDVEVVVVGTPPKPTPELLAIGKKRYDGECNRCHGDGGAGDGPSSYSLRDWKDDEILARDFRTGVFRAGGDPRDLFRRLKTGLNGTPMPSIPGTDEELWGLVYYMLEFVDGGAPMSHTAGGCGAGGAR